MSESLETALEPWINRPHKKKSLDVTILVFDKDDNCIREHKKNFKDKDHRRWLNTMLYWAISNEYSIEINS
jgi:hypothetical protein